MRNIWLFLGLATAAAFATGCGRKVTLAQAVLGALAVEGAAAVAEEVHQNGWSNPHVVPAPAAPR